MQTGELLTDLLGVAIFGLLCVCLALRKPSSGHDLEELEKRISAEDGRRVRQFRDSRRNCDN